MRMLRAQWQLWRMFRARWHRQQHEKLIAKVGSYLEQVEAGDA